MPTVPPPAIPPNATAHRSAADAAADSETPSALDQLLELNYNAASAAVWREPSLRPGQSRVLCHLGNPSKPRHVLVVMRPGGGKTHITRVAGVVERGIVLVVVMLHSLSADQMAKFTSANQAYGTVTAHNLDELFERSPEKYRDLLAAAGAMQRDTSTTRFLIASPQHLAHRSELTQMLANQAKNRVLRLVVVDEIHLFVQQGTSFRGEIRHLKECFFLRVFRGMPASQTPKLILTTGTMAKDYVPLASSMTMVNLPAASILWSPLREFEQRNIHMLFSCSGEFTKRLDEVVTFVQENDDKCVCIFIGSRSSSFDVLKNLERKLNEDGCSVDVMHVHGHLDKNEKFWFIRIFCANINVEELRARILLATSAADVGIDNHAVAKVLCLGWTRDLCSFFQRRARGGRDPATQSS